MVGDARPLVDVLVLPLLAPCEHPEVGAPEEGGQGHGRGDLASTPSVTVAGQGEG